MTHWNAATDRVDGSGWPAVYSTSAKRSLVERVLELDVWWSV